VDFLSPDNESESEVDIKPRELNRADVTTDDDNVQGRILLPRLFYFLCIFVSKTRGHFLN